MILPILHTETQVQSTEAEHTSEDLKLIKTTPFENGAFGDTVVFLGSGKLQQ